MHSKLVKDYMDHNPHSLKETCTVVDAVQSLLQHRILGCPVIDENKQLVGFISEQDCIKEILNEAFFCESSPAISTLMSREVITLDANTSIVDIAQAMAKSKPKNYPVVSNGKLVGLINRSDVLQALIESNTACHVPS